ncbi:MAG: DUF2500 family protein [Pirellulales bacterium]
MKCESCGADVPAGAAQCDYCGSAAAQPVASPRSSARPEVFAAIKRSPAYLRRNSPERLAALPKVGALEMAVPAVFLGVFILVSLVITLGMLSVGGLVWHVAGAIGVIPMCMVVVPLGFIVIGALSLSAWSSERATSSTAPILARPAIVTGKRTQVSGGGHHHDHHHSSVSTSYFITFEMEDGSRVEYATLRPALFGEVAESDSGVLFSRLDTAVAFDRVA